MGKQRGFTLTAASRSKATVPATRPSTAQNELTQDQKPLMKENWLWKTSQGLVFFFPPISHVHYINFANISVSVGRWGNKMEISASWTATWNHALHFQMYFYHTFIDSNAQICTCCLMRPGREIEDKTSWQPPWESAFWFPVGLIWDGGTGRDTQTQANI